MEAPGFERRRLLLGRHFGAKIIFHIIYLLLLPKSNLVDSSFIKSLPGFPGSLPFKLETGYIGVDEKDEEQLFYYFVESERNPRDDPLMLWLTGGPTCSALSGLAFEIGPMKLNMVEYNGSLPSFVLNPYSWTKVSSIIFVDAPIGSGFSYPKSLQWSSDTVFVNHAYSFFIKWLLNHPEFMSNPIYIGGDSYSGLIVPVVTHKIAKGIEAGNVPAINLKGYLLGNAATDPNFDQNSRIKYAHHMALIPDELYKSTKKNCRGQYTGNVHSTDCAKDLQAISACTDKIHPAHILERRCHSGFPIISTMDDQQKHPIGISEESAVKLQLVHLSLSLPYVGPPMFGCRNYENFLLHIWANDANVQKVLQVKKRRFWLRCNSSSLPYSKHIHSVCSYHRLLTEKGYRALIYSGDHDMLIPYLGTLAWIKSLNFTIINQWRPWLVDDQVAGYRMEYSNNLTFATVKGGGHTAPEYKPKECFSMFKRWISEDPL